MLGALGYVGYTREATDGELAAPTIFMPVDSFDFGDTNDFIIPDEIRNSPDPTVALPAPFAVSGSTGGNAYPVGLVQLLRAVSRGDVVTTANTGGGTRHVITPGRSRQDTFSFEGNADDILVRRYGGVRINSLELHAAFGEIVTASWGLEGINRMIVADPVAAEDIVYPDVDPFHFDGVSITVEGAEEPDVKDFTFGINNNGDRIGTLRKTRNWRRFTLGKREVSLAMTLDFTSDAEYQRFFDEDYFDVGINLAGPVLAGTERHSLDIAVPKVKWNRVGLPINAGDFLEQSVEATILRPAGGSIYTMTLVTTDTTA
jgi:hypothetical protein